jgi:hypothetical protein
MRKPDIQSAQDLASFVNRVVGVLGEEGDLNEKWAGEGTGEKNQHHVYYKFFIY